MKLDALSIKYLCTFFSSKPTFNGSSVYSGKSFNLTVKWFVAMWRLGFFFHEIAFGLLSVFIPLYVVTFKDTSILGGPLVALGVMTSIAIFCSIPASFLWGYLCDTTRHYKVLFFFHFFLSHNSFPYDASICPKHHPLHYLVRCNADASCRA